MTQSNFENLEQLISRKCQSTGEETELWWKCIKVLQRAIPEQELTDDVLVQIVTSCDSVGQIDFLTRSLYGFAKSRPPGQPVVLFLLEHVDRSPYGLKDWVEALKEMQNWLNRKGKDAPFQVRIGYLDCCAMTPDSNPSHRSLAQLMIEMLDEHGFERAVDK